jgi:GMP synthase (glutamine-hydrolysing)
MRKLLVFQHVAAEPLGTLDQQFRAAGFRIRYVNFFRQPDACPDVGRYHGLVVLGGPMSAETSDRHPHIAVEREAIREAIGRGMPVLGICLGAQLIAASLGARTLRGAAPEIGWFEVEPTPAARSDPLFAQLGPREHVFQWHNDTFTLPHGAVRLAESPRCAQQAFRYAETVYGLQFHLEVDAPLIRRWLATPSYLRELAAQRGSRDARSILADTERHIDRLHAMSRGVFGEFIRRFYHTRRRVPLPSR